MKVYFNRSMFFLSAAFIVYLLFEIYEVAVGKLTTESEFKVWNVLLIIKFLLLILVIAVFMRFMQTANRNRLFSKCSSRLWEYKSILLLLVGGISFIELRYNAGSSLLFASSIFLAAFCVALSKIFKDGFDLKEENDLTI